MLLAPKLNCNNLTSDLALPLALLGLLILLTQSQQLVKLFYLILAYLNVALNSLPLLMQVGLCHKCQMSLQFYDHDFPPLQWHIFIKNFWAFGIFLSSFTVTVSANTLVLTFTNTCDQIWKFLTLTFLNKVLIFKTILTGPEKNIVLRRSGLSLIFPL